MITIKKKPEIKILALSGAIASFVLKEITKNAKAGVATKELDLIARRIIAARSAKPSFLGFEGYPCAICISINDEVVHGIPSERKIKKGDIVGIDVGVEYRGMFTDVASTISIGKPSKEGGELIYAVKQALKDTISGFTLGMSVGDLEYLTGSTIKKHGFAPVLSLSGHGVGYAVHEDPSIKSDGKAGTGEILKPGMVLAIEPMATTGSGEVNQGADGWTIKTKEGHLAAHFEHTVVVEEDRLRILTGKV